MSADYERVEVTSAEQWRAWLGEHHHSSPGIWLVTWKKGRGPYIPYGDVVDQALCFGWVDSLPRRLDENRTQLLVTPRKPGSSWSRVNKQRVGRLATAGLLSPAGEAVVAAAKQNGTWTALDAVEQLIEPDDLRVALDDSLAARKSWDAFPRSTRRGILEWISAAKTDSTRSRRVDTTVSEATQGRRANQWRQPRNRNG